MRFAESDMEKYEEVLIALRRIIRAIDLHSRKLSKESGLTGPQLLIMRSIHNLGEVTIGEVARHVNLSQATVTTIMDRLEKRDLASRKRSVNDKRKVYTYLTEKGQALISKAPKPLQQEFIQQFQQLQDWEQSLLVSSVQRIATMMDAEKIDAAPVLEVGAIEDTISPNTNQ